MDNQIIFIRIACEEDRQYINEILTETERSAIARGSGIAKRTVVAVEEKIMAGKAIIAHTANGEWVGFSYLETWENNRFVSNSGLIVSPKFRNSGVAKAIKNRIFKLSRRLYPHSKIFSITSGSAVMRMNSRLGFLPVSYAEITHDDRFWEGCKSCVNYNVLQGKRKCNCLCTAMLFDPTYIIDAQPVVYQQDDIYQENNYEKN